MINALRSELIKLRTVRMNWVLGIIAIAFPLIVCGLTAALQNPDDINAYDFLSLANGTSVVTALLLGVIASVSITGEFAHGTIRPTFVATPNRWRVILAKGTVVAALAAIVETVVIIVTLAVSAAIASGRGADLKFGDLIDKKAPIVGLVIFTVLVTVLGFGLGLLIRNTPAALCVLILWPLLVENIVGAILSAAGVDRPIRFLPYASGIQLASPDDVTEGLGRLQGGVYFGAIAVGIAVVGAFITARRDA